MKDRIIEFLKAENKSSAQFAAEIGVQPSGISHILSGRNNPSLDFIIKMLEKYKYLSTEWLLFGKGKMYKDKQVLTLFDDPVTNQENTYPARESDRSDFGMMSETIDDKGTGINSETGKSFKTSGIKKIIWFYDNNEFEEFTPLNDRISV